ncbi:thiamine pyrophosphate-dependent enzyme [Humidisolicoccus flavus]|uniref:thiamine pyrophosphate-dependent enzyme n=1 Tax=Humidisolicoccus flavus TaxID=3111414 RepID=UPI003248E70A
MNTGPLRLLDAEGNRVESDATAEFAALAASLSTETLLAMHREMVLTRRFDTEAGNLQRQGKLGLWVPSIGQEGGQVGAAFALRPQDTTFPSYREHVVAHTRGVEFTQLMDVFRGAAHGGWDPKETQRFRIYSLVIGTQALHSAGYAMGVALDGKAATGNLESDEAVLAFFGDGASSQGDVSEGFVFSASFNAPIVYFMQDNKWAISVPSTTQFKTPMHERARGFGLSSVWIDGNDPLIGFAATRTALDAARQRKGPQFIEADTYRIGAHTTSDDPTKYRSSDEVEVWRRRDPIVRMAAYLRSLGVAESTLAEIDTEAEDEAAAVRKHVLEAPNPPSDIIFDHVYSDDHPLMNTQKRWLAEYERSFGDES